MRQLENGIVRRELDGIEDGWAPFWAVTTAAGDLLSGVLARTSQGPHYHSSWPELSADDRCDSLDLLSSFLDVEARGLDCAALVRSGLSPESSQLVDDRLREYHDSLPFTEAERRWLVDRYKEAYEQQKVASTGPGYYYPALMQVARTRGEIISLGRRRQVTGEELICRWWDWFRGGGDFEADTTVHSATKRAARRIIELVDETVHV